MTGDQKSRPNKEPWYGLSSRCHEENGLFWCEHWGIRHPGGVGSMWGSGGWRSGGETNGRVIPQPPWQDEASPVKVTHLHERQQCHRNEKKKHGGNRSGFYFLCCEASQIGRIATSLHNWDLKPRPKSTRCQDWRTVRGKRHLEPSSKVGHCTDLQCKRDCLGRWSEIKNRGGSIRGRSGSQRV